MDKEELQKNIALYYSKLPPEAQKVFSSMEWLETLKKISIKYGLNDKQKETLGTETTLVLLGIVHLVEYEETLTTELALSKDSRDRMLVEIDDSILKPIRPELMKVFDSNVAFLVEERPETETNWIKNINFILSGGDYSAFVERTGDETPPGTDKAKPIGTSSILDVKDKLIDINKK